MRTELIITADLLGEHLRVAGDHGQRRVDLMRHAGGEQADGRELLRLAQLRFEVDTLGDVVDDDQAPDHAELASNQWSDGDVSDTRIAGACRQPELVKVVNVRILADAIELFHEGRREDLAQALTQNL